jgi:hypothetical protein
VAKSATGSVYDLGDTGFLTPLNLTLVATNTVTTSLISDANGMFPDFTLVDRTQCAFKSGTQVFVLTTTTPIPGPTGPTSTVPGPPGPATTDASLLAAGTVADARLPTRLQDTALNATYAPVAGSTNYVQGTSPANALGAAVSGIAVTDAAYGAKGDAVVLVDATMTSGSAVLTSAAASFASQDVGKLIYVTSAGGSSTPLKTTIASFQSATQVTLAAAAVANSWVIGGPNANCVYGTDNAAAFNAALTAAAASVLPSTDLNARYRRRKPVIVPSGNFLIGQALTPLAVSGINIIGYGRLATTLMFCDAGAMFSAGTYNATPSDAYQGTAAGLSITDMSLTSPVYIPTSFEGVRVSNAIQDNGCGDIYLRSVYFNGFKYGFNGAYGSDFTCVDANVYFANCDVGAYFGVGSQQLKLNGPDFYRCREGLVFEGAPHFIMTGGSFEDPLISAITFDGKSTGVTRSGVPVSLSGASYDGSWSIYGTWFESNAGGSGRLAPRMVWMNGDPPGAANFTGPTIWDCVLVSGGTQVGAGTAAFLEMATQYLTSTVIDRLKIRGNFINYVQNNSSGSATSDTRILSTPIPTGSGIVYYRGSSGSGVTDDAGMYTSGGRTLASRFSGATPLSLSMYGSGGGGTGWGMRIRTDSSSTVLAGITQGGAWVGPVKLTTLASAGAVTIDASIATVTTVTLQANATSSTITNPFTGQIMRIQWKQDATGGRTYAWPANCKFAGGAAPADTTASKMTSVTFAYDGTNWNETGRAVAVG